MRAVIIFIILLACAAHVLGEGEENVTPLLKNYRPYINCGNTIYEICTAYAHSAFYTFKFKEFRYTPVGDGSIVTVVFSVSKPRIKFLSQSSVIAREEIGSVKEELLIEWTVGANRRVRPSSFFAYDAIKIFESDFKKGHGADLIKK